MSVNKYYYYKIFFFYKFFQDSTILYNQYLSTYIHGTAHQKYILDVNVLLLDFFFFNKIYLYTILNDRKVVLLFSGESQLYSLSIFHFNMKFLNIGLIDVIIQDNQFLFKNFKGLYTNYINFVVVKTLRKKANLLSLYSKLVKNSNLFYFGQFGYSALCNKIRLPFKFIINANDYFLETRNLFPDFFLAFIENKMSSYFYEWCSAHILNSCFCNLNVTNILLKKINYPVIVGDFTSEKIYFLVNFLVQNFTIGLLDCFFNYISKLGSDANFMLVDNTFVGLNFFSNIKYIDLGVKRKLLLQFLILKKEMNFNPKVYIFMYLYILYIFNNLKFEV